MKEKKDKPKPLTAAGRKRRASKAGKASGNKRTKKAKLRNIGLYDAYLYLEKDPTQNKESYLQGYHFLIANGISARIKAGDPSPYHKLADGLGVTSHRIGQIVREERKKRANQT